MSKSIEERARELDKIIDSIISDQPCSAVAHKLSTHVQAEIDKAVLDGKKSILLEEVIPLFDGLFTDGEYRKYFYKEIDKLVAELEAEKDKLNTTHEREDE